MLSEAFKKRPVVCLIVICVTTLALVGLGMSFAEDPSETVGNILSFTIGGLLGLIPKILEMESKDKQT